MRKAILIVGFVLLLQLSGVSQSQAAPPPQEGFWHTVQSGETLFSIGRRYGVNPYTLCTLNGLYNCNHIWRGQRLWIPVRVTPPPGSCLAYHTVSRGQTLFGIGRFYGVSAWAIAAANRIYNLNYIYVGQRLCIPY